MSNLIDKYVSPYLKAHAAALVSAAYLLGTDLATDKNPGLGAITANQWWAIAAAAGLSFGVVHTVANTVASDVPAVAAVVNAVDPAVAPVVADVAAVVAPVAALLSQDNG